MMTGNQYGEYKNLNLDASWDEVKLLYQNIHSLRQNAPYMFEGEESREGPMLGRRFSVLEKTVNARGLNPESMPDGQIAPSDVARDFFSCMAVDRFGLKPLKLIVHSFKYDKRFRVEEKREEDDTSLTDLTIYIRTINLYSPNLDIFFKGDAVMFGACDESLLLKNKRTGEELKREIKINETCTDKEINEIARYIRTNI